MQKISDAIRPFAPDSDYEMLVYGSNFWRPGSAQAKLPDSGNTSFMHLWGDEIVFELQLIITNQWEINGYNRGSAQGGFSTFTLGQIVDGFKPAEITFWETLNSDGQTANPASLNGAGYIDTSGNIICTTLYGTIGQKTDLNARCFIHAHYMRGRRFL